MNYIPISNLEAERAILGSIYFENSLLKQIEIKVSDFYSIRHQHIFEAMLKLDTDNIPIDLISLQKLVTPEELIDAREIAAEVVTTANINYHCPIVIEAAKKRSIQKMCLKALSDIEEGNELDEVVGQINKDVESVYAGSGPSIMSMKEVIRETYQFIERRYENRDVISGVPSGLRDLDSLLDGFQGGESIIIAGRPSSGKTALALTCALNAGENNVPAGVLSIEMASRQLGVRCLSSTSQVDMWKLRKGFVKKDDWAALSQAAAKLSNLPVYFDFVSYKLNDIRKAIFKMIQVYKCKIIFIDYLQLASSDENMKREREIANISRSIKRFTNKFDIPIITLSQLNRNSEREERRPIMADLRESGAIEQDADVIIFTYRSPEEKQKETGITELIIGKGRNIGFGTVRVQWSGNTQRYQNLEANLYENKEG